MRGKIEALVLRDFANIFRRLEISDIRVEVQPDGWYVAMVDPGNVRIAEVLLRKDGWEEYDFAPKTFAIDVDRLYRFASDFKKGEIVEIVFDDTKEMEATFYLNGTLTRTFTLLGEEAIRAKPKIPELEYRIELTLLRPQIDVVKGILATKLEGDWGNEIAIGIVERAPEEYELCLYVADDEGIKNKGCVDLERATNYLVIEECASVYNFDYFKSVFGLLTKEVVATGTVTIQFAFEYPMKIGYERKGLEVKQILLAPRVDEEKKLTERDVLEELHTPFKPKEEEEVEVEIESTATTLYFLPTAKGRLLKPFKRTEYGDDELIDVLLGQPLPELKGILGSLKLEAIWKETSYGKYSAIVKEEELSREPADIDAIIKIVENYKLMKYPYLEIREYYKHPEQLEKEEIELKDRVDALTRYFFGGFGAKIVTIEGFLTYIKDSKGTEEDREGIRKSFAWVKKKYEQIPFSELSESPYYDDYKPLFAINEILPELAKNIALALSEGGKYCDTAIGQLKKIHELGREYTKTTEKYYKELTGQSLREADVETRALMEYRSKEQIQDQVSWLKEQGIEPNSFEKAAMEYYGVEITEEEPPWRRLMNVLKELEKEHGLEVPEDIAITAAMEVGIEKPEDLIGDLKRDGILYSPAKGLIARVEKEEKILKESTENGWIYKKILDGEYAGSLEIWDMGEGEYKIENIDVTPAFRRRGVASDLIEEVIKDFVPYNELKWGMQTEEGAKLKEALDKKYTIIEEPKEPWMMTKEEFVEYHKTGTLPDDAYEEKTVNDFEWLGQKEKHPKLIRTYKAKNGENIELRQTREKLGYTKLDEEGEIVREKGLAVYLTDEEIQEKKLPLYDTTVVAFNEKGQPIGYASNEFGADGVWIAKEYQKQGIGVELLIELRKQFGPMRRIGQMTHLGERMALAYHRRQIEEALKEGKPVPEEVLKDYPDLKKPIPFDWGHFIKDLEVKHYTGYRTETAYGLGGRDLRSVVKYEIEELENTDIIDWTSVPDYIATIDALYAHGYTEAVWLCKDKQHVIDSYCDGDPACPIEKYEITDGILLSDLGEDGQLVAYQPKKVKITEEKEKPKEIAFLPPPTHLLDNPKKVEWVSVQAQTFKDIASPRDLRARAWSEHVKATGLKPAMDAKDFYQIFDEQWEFGFKKSWQESQKEWEEVPETPQETIARVMKFKSYTGSRPDWQFLLQKAVNDVDMLKADRYDLMRATGKLLGYNLTPEPSNVGLDRWLAQQLANETGQSVLMIGGSVTVEPEKKAKEPWMMTYTEFFDIAGSEYTAGERFGVPTKNRMPINPDTGYPIKGATPEERIHRAVLMKALKEGKTIPEEVLRDYPDLIKKPPEEEIVEEKWENITKEKLEEIRRTSKFSEKYAISQAKAAKKVSATEETVYEKLPDELDLGPYSEVLLYTPVEEIRYLSKAERAAFIKLVDRGWFQVYRVSKPVSDKYPSGFTYVLKKTREEEKPPEKGILFYKYVKKELDEGAVVYTSYPTPVSEILIAQLPDGRWNVHPDPPLFPEKPFKKRTEALEYAETNMKTIIEEETGEKPEKIPEVPPPYELIKKERLSPEELEQLKKDIADLKRTREAWEKQLPGYEARQAIPELDRDIAEYEAKVKEEEKEEAKAEIKKRIKPIKPLISEAEGAITECDKGFETCLEFCDDDLEECYDRCHEEYEDTKDIEKCRKECEKERDKCHDKCEAGATECYDDSAKEVIGEDIEEGDITKAEEDLETFMDYISDELYKKLAEKLPKKVVEEEKIKVRVLEDIPTFMGTDGEIYKLNKEDIVELPKTNADVLCERGVAEPFVEKPPEEPVPEKVKIHGVLKTRYRCPICYRAAPDNFCMVHSDVEAIDLLAADEPIKEAVIDLTFLDLFKTKYPEKKRWTIEELHEAIGIDTAYAPEFLDKTRIPETYAQYYARELGVEIEEIKPPEVVKPPVEERTETQEMIFEYFKKEIDKTDVDAYQRGYLAALHREIGREFTTDHLLLADSEELYRLMDLQREELEAALRRRLTTVPPSVVELAEKEKMEILRKMRRYKKVEAEVPELKIGAKVSMNGKEGVLVDISANKYRANWDDGTWDWITQKDSEFIVVY